MVNYQSFQLSITYFGTMCKYILVASLVMISCAAPQGKVEESNLPQLAIELKLLHAVQSNHIRGLHLLNDEIAWASGAAGTFMRCVDGNEWSADTIAGYTHLDFRDVHAFTDSIALVMAAGDEGRILRTEDGGDSWIEVYTRLDTGIFLDGMDFFGNVGYCYGDPIDGKMVLIKSEDQGRTWTEVDLETIPSAMPKEAGFAASGTGIIVNGKTIHIATGGDIAARVLTFQEDEWNAISTPMRGGEACGIFSMAFVPPSTLVTVGGCYLDLAASAGNCAISNDNGMTWELISENQPRGYRSCVAYSESSDLLVACGRTGIDYSLDQGRTWSSISDEGFYTCSLGDSTGWLMGRGGKLAKLTW
ncbi:MAG: photosystem II stability/assembly factor-like uncharacterized protein [Bacteroidia bacterium]